MYKPCLLHISILNGPVQSLFVMRVLSQEGYVRSSSQVSLMFFDLLLVFMIFVVY